MSEFNEKQSKVLDVLFKEGINGDLRKAMNEAGYTSSYSITVFLSAEGMQEAVRKETNLFLASTSSKAVGTIYGMLEGKGKLGDKEKLAAAKDLLDRTEFKGTDKVEIEVSSPLFILPPKEDDEEED